MAQRHRRGYNQIAAKPGVQMMANDLTNQSATDSVASHIVITSGVCGGKPRIAGHRIRVQDIVIWTEEGHSADEIVADFPQLSLAQIYAALAYYHDHREQIDRDIREEDRFIDEMKSQAIPGLPPTN
jgi:uncharacterized protein (DUF433 family)